MNILNAVEQEAFESAPVFNSFQRKQYFDFPQAIQQATANLRTPANQLCFLLSCGYFKASKRFFPARTFHPRDVEYVVGRTGLRLGIFQQRYVKRHGIVAADTVPPHEKREALDLNIVHGMHHAGAGREPSGSMAGPDSEKRLELGSIAARRLRNKLEPFAQVSWQMR
jgi:hypothetical protein